MYEEREKKRKRMIELHQIWTALCNKKIKKVKTGKILKKKKDEKEWKKEVNEHFFYSKKRALASFVWTFMKINLLFCSYSLLHTNSQLHLESIEYNHANKERGSRRYRENTTLSHLSSFRLMATIAQASSLETLDTYTCLCSSSGPWVNKLTDHTSLLHD